MALDYTTHNIFVSTSDSNATLGPFNRQIVRVVVPPTLDEKYVIFSSLVPVEGIYMYRDTSADKDSSSWAQAQVVESSAVLNFGYAGLMHDGNGNLHAMYRRSPAAIHVRHAVSVAGGAFGGHVTVPFNASYHTEWSAYCLDTLGRPHAFCLQVIGGQYRPYHSYKIGGVWQLPVQLPRRLSLSYGLILFTAVAFERGGQHCIELFFIERNPTYYEVTNLYSSNGGTSWTLAANKVDPETYHHSSYCSVAYDPVRDKIYFAYQKVAVPEIKYQIHLRSKTPLTQSWSDYTRVNAAFASIGAVEPSVTIGPDGRVYVAWRQKNQGVRKGGSNLQEEET